MGMLLDLAKRAGAGEGAAKLSLPADSVPGNGLDPATKLTCSAEPEGAKEAKEAKEGGGDSVPGNGATPGQDTARVPAQDTDRTLDPIAEKRRARVLAMLETHPGVKYAVLTDTEADPEAVILALAIRGQASFELRVPPKKYDPWLLLTLIERHSGTIH